MNIRTIKYYFVEGFVNLIRYKIMSLASVSIMISALVLLGAFLVITRNLEYNTNNLNNQPEMQVFCEYNLDSAQISELEKEFKNNPRILTITKVSRKEAMEKVKEYLGNDESLIDGLDESFLPISFIIKMKDPAQTKMVAEEIRKMAGIKKVKFSQRVVEFISNFISWIQYASAVLVTMLMIISIFIISNTVKLAMYARRKEIGIMKYVGATDWFIRWPYVVEGVIIGAVSSIVAMIVVGYGYSFLFNEYQLELKGVFGLISIKDMLWELVGVYLFIGTLVGIVGSIISIRRYLDV